MKFPMTSFLKIPIKVLLPAIILAIALGLAYQLSQKPLAPNLSLTTIDGKQLSIQSLQGKVVLINFWATDCPGCIEEMPALIETYQNNPNHLEIIAVAMPHDDLSQVINYSKRNKLPFPVVHDATGTIAEQFNNVKLTPTAFIIDKTGHIIGKTIGIFNFTAFQQLLDKQ
jgi:peroxiredoxin